ncbi:acid protease [Bimuria novae-zelandiae CBS 107.79]|uniref:Acid protease n=1 Tax=Bimuria novae-zelandiae CBS 107.79 TaxID=1447943 RepID=A0A6A5UP68_9PLEO|nr:acid protease [Bimuria novae-zelandiae CBS 107.79]
MSLWKRADVNTTSSVGEPRIVQTTGTFDGNDGDWSTFYINVGDKDNNGGGQNFKILPSTWFGVTLAPFTAEWCEDDECAQDRGVGTVNGEQYRGLATTNSSTWREAGTYDLDLPPWWFNSTDKPRGYYGLDYLGIGPASPKSYVVPKMYVAATTSTDFYLGQFGLGYGTMNLGGAKGNDVDSIIHTFKKTSTIPSSSYGYTAGAKYRNRGTGVLGSLVLGGYDDTRINSDNRVSIDMPSQQNNSLVVGVQSVSYKPDVNVEGNVFSFTQDNVKGFWATIDSTFPYLWLPEEVCDNFAEKFNLKWNNETNFYSLNATGAQNNDQQNAVVTFRIGSDPFGGGDEYTTINLPWSAFDLTFTDPEDRSQSQKYFPIRKSPNGMFVLGRTLLQEAYLLVDYERANFTVASTPSLDNTPDPKLVPIYDKSYVPPSPTPIPTSTDKGLSGGAIAGIVVGILLVALGAAFGIFMWWKKRRERKNAPPDYKETTEIDTAVAGNEVKHRRVSELESQTSGSPKPDPGGFYAGDRERKDLSPFPAISEMDSPPAELYSPPAVASTPHSEVNSTDYFTAGSKLSRGGAPRESSANNSPGTSPPFTPIAELPGDDGGYQVGGQHFDPVISPKGSPTLKSGSVHRRDPSATPSQNIDEVMKGHSAEPSPARPAKDESAMEGTTSQDKKPETEQEEEALERRPSHTRGLSDTTVQSDTTVVSQPTPEELERWALAEDEQQPRRPLSE